MKDGQTAREAAPFDEIATYMKPDGFQTGPYTFVFPVVRGCWLCAWGHAPNAIAVGLLGFRRGWRWGGREDARFCHFLLDLFGACCCYGGGCTESVDGFDKEVVHCRGIDETDGRVSKERERRWGSG